VLAELVELRRESQDPDLTTWRPPLQAIEAGPHEVTNSHPFTDKREGLALPVIEVAA
jgi:hypothetical protein